MAAPNPPRAAFLVKVTLADYQQASRIASRHHGWLREARVGLLLCGSLTAMMTVALRQWRWASLSLLVLGSVLCVLMVWLMRQTVERTAQQNYRLYATLFSPATATLWEDWMELSGVDFRQQEAWARFTELVETRTLFVLLLENGTFFVLPKRDFPQDSERAMAFLRQTFARKYRRMR